MVRECCFGIWHALTRLCCNWKHDDDDREGKAFNENTRLTVKCHTRQTSSENALFVADKSDASDSSGNCSDSSLDRPSSSSSSRSPAPASRNFTPHLNTNNSRNNNTFSADHRQMSMSDTQLSTACDPHIIASAAVVGTGSVVHAGASISSQLSLDALDSGVLCTPSTHPLPHQPSPPPPPHDTDTGATPVENQNNAGMKHAQSIADISWRSLKQLKASNTQHQSNNSIGGGASRWSLAARRLTVTQQQQQHATPRHNWPQWRARTTPLVTASNSNIDQTTAAGETGARQHKLEDVTHGRAVLTLRYTEASHQLHVQLQRLVGLPLTQRDNKGEGRVYVAKLSVLPDERVMRGPCVAPLDEQPSSGAVEWSVPLKPRRLDDSTVRISVHETRLPEPHDVLGHALVPLAGTVCETPQRYIVGLQHWSQPACHLGTMLLTTLYCHDSSRNCLLHVTVHGARHLRLAGSIRRVVPARSLVKNAQYDTYVKASLRCGGHKICTRRSRLEPATRQPDYSQAHFQFVVPGGCVAECRVVVSVVLRPRALLSVAAKHVVMGRVLLGPHERQLDGTLTHWGRTVTQHGQPVTQWHNLHL